MKTKVQRTPETCEAEQKEIYMKNKIIRSFKYAKHESDVPYQSALCCNSRLNRQISVTELEKPRIYGLALKTEDQIKITHEAIYSCACRKTKINVEGTYPEIVIKGCFGYEKEL